jgi:hypothetical protein
MDQFDVVFSICYYLDCVDLLRLRLVSKSLLQTCCEAWKDLKKSQPLISSLERNSSLMNNLLYGEIKSLAIKKSEIFERILFVDSQFVVCLTKTKRKSNHCVQVFSVQNQQKIFSCSSRSRFSNDVYYSSQINYPLLVLKTYDSIKVFDFKHKHQLLTDFLPQEDDFWLINQKLILLKTSTEPKFLKLIIHDFDLPKTHPKRKTTKSFHFSDEITTTQLTLDRFLILGIRNHDKCEIYCIDLFTIEMTLKCLFKLESGEEIRKFFRLESGDVIAVSWYGFIWLRYENEKYTLGNQLWIKNIIWKVFLLRNSIMGEQNYETLQWFYKESRVQTLTRKIYSHHIKDNSFIIKNDVYLLNDDGQELKINTNYYNGIINGDTIGQYDRILNFYDIIAQTKVRSFAHPVKEFDSKCIFWFDNPTSTLNLLSN